MNPDTTSLIFGPPGTGKTHELIRIVESLLESGHAPDEVCYVAFTRKAANEARDRAMEKFKFTRDQLPYFRTLHALAFMQLGLSKTQVMGYGDYVKLAQMLGIYITFKGVSEDGTVLGLSRGDRLFFMENMARAQMIDLKEFWESRPDEDVYWYELLRLHETVVEYKAINGKMDFTDMITKFCEIDVVPQVKSLLLDEAQDLTPLQWKMIDKLSVDVEETYIAGDDDQAIFRWAGADPSRFMGLPGSRRVLPLSYRVPTQVQQVAEVIVKRISSRVEKEWSPAKHEGSVEYVNSIDQVDMSEGTWLLLARNVYLLKQFNDHCLSSGLVFSSHLGSPMSGATLRAIKSWEMLRREEPITKAAAMEVYDHMSSRRGVSHGGKSSLERVPENQEITVEYLRLHHGLLVNSIWHEALDKIPPQECEYFLAALRRGEKLLKEPRIRIETIHGVKGGEADSIVVCTDMADRTWREYEQSPDDEHRVWYVAVTRARRRLFIMSPQTNMSYVI